MTRTGHQTGNSVKQLIYRIGPTCHGRRSQTGTDCRMRYCRGVMLGRRPKYTRLVDGSRTYLGVVDRQEGEQENHSFLLRLQYGFLELAQDVQSLLNCSTGPVFP